MLKALYYKEWLKMRWVILILAAVFILDAVRISLGISYNLRFSAASNYWYDIVVRGRRFYSDLYLLPFLAGIVTAAFQFAPEILADRLKLTLHLPLAEKNILLTMISFGLSALLLIFLITYVLLLAITLHFFPVEILSSLTITALPWFLAGIAGYLLVSAVFVEPVWIKRLVLFVLSVSLLDLLSYKYFYNLYEQSILGFLLITIFLITSVLYPAQRFRKGVRR